MNPLKQLYDQLPAGTRSAIRSWMPDSLKRWYAHRNTDVYLISYPKCGRTWLRLMVGRAIAQHFGLPEDEDMLFIRWKKKPHPQVPWITVIHDDRPMLKAPEELQTSKSQIPGQAGDLSGTRPAGCDRLQLLRDEKPRPACLAIILTRAVRQSSKAACRNLFAIKSGGFETILSYYNIWAENRNIPRGFLLVRYEDMKANAQHELRRVIDFLGLGIHSGWYPG